MPPTKWVIDASASSDEFLCFVPVEGDIEENPTFVLGFSLLSNEPPGELVGIIHSDGQQAVDEWYEQNKERVLRVNREDGKNK